MSTAILISSSPPAVFARSPTPVGASSPLPSTAALIQGDSPRHKKFKNSVKPRDGFRPAFTTARQVFAEKDGAKNLLIGSPRRDRFVSSQDSLAKEATREENSALNSKVSDLKECANATQEYRDVTTGLIQPSAHGLSEVIARPVKRVQRVLSPLLLEKAATRRLDWTPPKAVVGERGEEKTIEYSAGYLSGVVGNFAYIGNIRNDTASRSESTEHPNKRRRTEDVSAKKLKKNTAALPPRLIPAIPVTKNVSRKRNRSPTKKGLTITGLATSNFFDQDGSNDSPMMQYLTSTQAQLNDNDIETGLQTKVKRTKAAAKNSKTTKRNQPQSLLLSPESAMRTYDEQDTIFGSASQLAREESPGLLKEIIEAMKQSESFVLSDPPSSPPRTQFSLHENKPQTGTSKYRKTRNLWAAAGRDEDNALLHVDTVDLTDTPAIRAAFVGKDVMLQPSVRRSKSPIKSGPIISNSRTGDFNNNVMDIADLETPCHQQRRAMSSISKPAEPQDSGIPSLEEPDQMPKSSTVNPAPAKEKAPPKPNYAGFATSDLQKQIKAFGFKAMRKREKMIELLDRCWEEKYGPSEKLPEAEPEVVPFHDFLSKVHDISARAEPKVKKPRTRKKKDEAGAEAEPGEKSAKKPRQRKKKDVGDEKTEDKPKVTKAPRKRKSKAAAVAQQMVLDIDDIGDTISEEQRALCAFDDWAKPPLAVKNKTKTQTQSKIVEPATTREIPQPPTPPATLPQTTNKTATTMSQSTASTPTQIAVAASTPVLTPSKAPVSQLAEPPSTSACVPPIHSQITAAILRQTQSGSTNHNTHPTWHEKILLYDPIVLEELAQWLNTEGLGAIGEDREVSGVEVRGWCEQRGVCCLWKGGWRGNKEGRSG